MLNLKNLIAKDWIEWHNWQTSQATVTSRPVTSLGHQEGRIILKEAQILRWYHVTMRYIAC